MSRRGCRRRPRRLREDRSPREVSRLGSPRGWVDGRHPQASALGARARRRRAPSRARRRRPCDETATARNVRDPRGGGSLARRRPGYHRTAPRRVKVCRNDGEARRRSGPRPRRRRCGRTRPTPGSKPCPVAAAAFPRRRVPRMVRRGCQTRELTNTPGVGILARAARRCSIDARARLSWRHATDLVLRRPDTPQPRARPGSGGRHWLCVGFHRSGWRVRRRVRARRRGRRWGWGWRRRWRWRRRRRW